MRFTEEEWAEFQRKRGLKPDPVKLAPAGPSEYWKEIFRLEKDFQAWVLAVARKWGWRHYHTHRSDKSPKGWPDLVLAHQEWGIVLFRELKLEGRRPNGRPAMVARHPVGNRPRRQSVVATRRPRNRPRAQRWARRTSLPEGGMT